MKTTHEWIEIPTGTFLMGAQSEDPNKPNYDPQALEWESSVHEVKLEGYRIARYPVTVGQYAEFMEDEGYGQERWWKAGGFGRFNQPWNWYGQILYHSRPVVGVSWWEAVAYSVWAGVRLPTEAEWERAARGTEGRKYPWGNEEPNSKRANFIDSKVGHPTPFGLFPSDITPEGVLDMGGNVSEWCADWFGDYPSVPVSDPRGPEEATLRVVRGGAWSLVAVVCRAAFRFRFVPEYRGNNLGFRVVEG